MSKKFTVGERVFVIVGAKHGEVIAVRPDGEFFQHVDVKLDNGKTMRNVSSLVINPE